MACDRNTAWFTIVSLAALWACGSEPEAQVIELSVGEWVQIEDSVSQVHVKNLGHMISGSAFISVENPPADRAPDFNDSKYAYASGQPGDTIVLGRRVTHKMESSSGAEEEKYLCFEYLSVDEETRVTRIRVLDCSAAHL
jgi:hypothetical protein